MDEAHERVCVLDNEIEAGALATLLDTRDVPYLIQSYHDSAYDGLFQNQKGWGCVMALPEHAPAILAALEDLRSGSA